jgi:LmbE family N-acetylglucosaminyl deacetylase
MSRILVLSPHFDDAVFSVCEHMVGWIEDGHHVEILTVFGATTNDKELRIRDEHARAMALLRPASRQVLWHRDHAHKDRYEPTPEEIASEIRERAIRPDYLVGPHGIHHPDHLLVGEAARALEFDDWCRKSLWVYDELPYYVLYPRAANGSGPRLGSRSLLETKRLIVSAYASQLGETEERCLYAPERVWGTW